MPVPSFVLDGAMAYGSRTLTINAVTYKVVSLDIARPTVAAEDNLQTSAPGRKRWTGQRAQLTATLQLATGSTAYPQFGNTFTDTFDSNYGSETFVITEPPYSESNDPGEIRTVSITAEAVLIGITTA